MSTRLTEMEFAELLAQRGKVGALASMPRIEAETGLESILPPSHEENHGRSRAGLI